MKSHYLVFHRVSSVSSIHEDRLNEESVDDVESERPPEHKEEDSAMPVPQVKVGPDGSLILDEQSIVSFNLEIVWFIINTGLYCHIIILNFSFQ